MTGVEQNGQLGEHPLAELIRETSQAGLSGAFRLTGERVKTVVYFDAGTLVFAASNLRQHRLSHSALRLNFITEQQLSDLGSFRTDAELAAALLEREVLTRDKVDELLSQHVADVLRPALLWTEGTWSFDPRVRLVDDWRAKVSLPPLLMETARRLPPEFIVKRFKHIEELLTLSANPATGLDLLPVEAFMLSRLETGALRVQQLMAISGLPGPDTLRAVYALAFGGFLKRGQWPRAFNVNLTEKLQAMTRASQKTPEAVPAPRKIEQVPEVKVVEEVDERREMEQFLIRMDKAETHYEVLGIGRNVSPSDIKRAYHSLARRFHPDRFHQESGTETHTRLQAAFARVAQAHDVLKDSRSRSAYDLRVEAEQKMRATRSFQPSRSMPSPGGSTKKVPRGDTGKPEAEDNFRQGLLALKQGNFNAAMAHLGEAARHEPRQARYRAAYGRALATNDKMRHQAETELQAAIMLETNNIAYRVMLAEFYRDHGMQQRALSELQRALTMNPRDEAARRLLDELSGKG